MIIVERLTKQYETKPVLKEISLSLSANETVVIVGPSGCGKTTLLRIIAGLERPTDGRVVIDEKEVSSSQKIIPPNQRHLAMIFQDLALWPHMTVAEHIAFALKPLQLSKEIFKSKTKEVLDQVRLGEFENRYPRKLSGGERQRLALARALAPGTKYLLMDEPFSNLDAILREDLEELLLCLKKERQLGMIYVTHHIEEAFELSDRIAVMNQGVIEQADTKENILRKPKNDFVRRLLKVARND